MKKMSEVFDDMPLHIDGITCMMDIYQQSNPDEPHQLVAKHAAHAINHVDAIADALDALVSDYNQYRAINGIDLTDDHCAKLDVKMATAEAALQAYRGEK